MGMEIEVVGVTTYTVHLDDEDVKKIKSKLKKKLLENPWMCGISESDVCESVNELYSENEISLYSDKKAVESDFYTDEIRWSEFEEREPDEIFEINE